MQGPSGARRLRMRALLLATTIAGLTGGASAVVAAGERLLESGSTLLYPLVNLWVLAYTKSHAGVHITAHSTGSGAGIAQVFSGVVQLGASDAYIGNAQLMYHPGMLSIAVAISSVMVNYNIPGLNTTHLKLSGPVLAGIYAGRLTNWNDAAIAELNPGVKLPANPIVPVHRSDGSGDTFIFTQYLSDSTPSWARTQSYGTTIGWPPVARSLGGQGNQGMVDAIKQTPYSIAYIGISWKSAIDQNNLGTALLNNQAGKFLLPTVETVKAAADAYMDRTPADERISLIFVPGDNAYPIVNYEYMVVNDKQPTPAVAKAIRDFLLWIVQADGGNAQSFMDRVGFVPLPESVRRLSERQIAKISGPLEHTQEK